SGSHTPGPHIIPIDYEALYRMKEPPEYKPFEVYGYFLLSVATQQTPLVMNPQAPVPEHVIKMSDVIFKKVDGVDLGVDIYQPKGDTTPNPLVLIIHGGYWKSGDKAVHVQQGVEFAELGYTAASVNYRLSADHKFPANIEDIFDGIKYLTEHATEFNIDPKRIMTYGGSAGGHLSALIGLAANTKGRSYNEGIHSNAIKGIITLYGMHDLTLHIQKEHPYTKQYIGQTFEEASAKYRDASPIYHVDRDDPPVLLIHGSIDGSVSVKNSDALAEMLGLVGVAHTYDRIEGWPHGMDFFSPIGERTLWQIYQFLKTYMPSDEMKTMSSK
ncbi:MAG: alpha/beta hydrolase, partial [Zetaproteobacteria bacterium]|nr:alpha/beta hydrolase [Zetaproteobacteria bacterium]